MKLVLAAAALAAPAAAQAPGTPVIVISPSFDPAALEAARDLLKSIEFDALMEKSAHQSALATFDTMVAAEEQRQGESMPADLKAAIRAAVRSHVSELVADLKKTGMEDAARVYARYFSADELRELQRLQAHPVMKKAQLVSPSLFAELAQVGVRAAAAVEPKLKATLDRVVAEWVAKHRPPPRS